ncbi:GLIPR1-like protein 1 isoform X1 [Argopecten irradians]|uniref:GLIPR1-like protein 1 isoform X1 n=1 Tax=Argopecten irradians TaxID=31199 RepID=UPI003714D3C0
MSTMELCLWIMAVCVGTLNGARMDVSPYRDLLVDIHNNYRRQVQPSAANMQVMTWNQTLSDEAASWIQSCDFEHQSRGRGENLAFDTHSFPTRTLITNALKSWYDERNIYSFGPQSCDRACHYTQMVWAKTTQVGCAMVRCPRLTAFGRTYTNAWYLGCFYLSRGNWIGETPYTRGAPCSQCLQGQTCDRKLCRGRGQELCEDNKSSCQTWATIGECSKNPVYMRKNCRKACGECRGTDESSECVDKNRSCATWASTGECRKNKAWMLPNCPKSCRVCTDGGDESGNDNGSGSGNDGQEGGDVCRDKLSCCADMQQKGYCRRYRRFMRENCPSSCSQC